MTLKAWVGLSCAVATSISPPQLPSVNKLAWAIHCRCDSDPAGPYQQDKQDNILFRSLNHLSGFILLAPIRVHGDVLSRRINSFPIRRFDSESGVHVSHFLRTYETPVGPSPSPSAQSCNQPPGRREIPYRKVQALIFFMHVEAIFPSHLCQREPTHTLNNELGVGCAASNLKRDFYLISSVATKIRSLLLDQVPQHLITNASAVPISIYIKLSTSISY